MERQFTARFDLTSIIPISENQWSIVGYIIDNTGNFFASSSSIGNIIYMDGSMLGLQVLRYKVINVDYEQTSGTELYADIEWDMGSDYPMEPFPGLVGIIGETTDKIKLSILPSIMINLLDENFINSIKNYENLIIVDNLAKIDSPEFVGKPLVPTPDKESNDQQIANTEWVSTKIEVMGNTKIYTALENIESFKVLYIDDFGNVGLADGNNVNHADAIIGISLESKQTGEQILVKLNGLIKNESWSFEKTGQIVFVGSNGDLSLKADSVEGFIQQIGITTNIDSITLDIEEAVLL